MKSIIKLSGFLFVISYLLGANGHIKGIVRDQATHKPLIGVNVIIEGTELGAASNENGQFLITTVPSGSHHVRFEMIGYQPLVKMNVWVSDIRIANVTAELVQQPVELAAVTVTRAYFEKGKDAFVSSRTVDFEEIRSDPAGAIDIQRMMQALPSVVSASDQMNEIVVRGGAPGENLFIMDNIEIANPNHFGQQGTGGGPINLVNTLFIDRVDFLAGAFPAKYGDKASSVMDISMREGNRDYHSLDLDMSMAGLGINSEGPIFGGRGSYLASYRLSYLQFIIKSIGLTAVPHYWNTQGKITYDINPTNKLTFNFVYGDDYIDIVGENTPQTRGAENVNAKDNQLASGMTYKHLWQSEGMSRYTIAYTRAQFVYDVYRYTGNGIKQTYYDQDETEWDLQLKTDFVWRLNPKIELSGGVDLKQIGMDFDAYFIDDTIWQYVYSLPNDPDTFTVVDRTTWENYIYPVMKDADPDSIYLDANEVWNYGRKTDSRDWELVRAKKDGVIRVYDDWSTRKNDSYLRYGGFFQFKWRPLLKLSMNLGLRVGYNSLTEFSWLSPRLGFSYHLTERSTINLALARHFQTPELVILMNDPENEKLRSKYTNQLVVGYEYFFSEDTRGTIELYWKDYYDIPVNLSSTTIDTSDRSSIYVNEGQGKSYGVELFLQKKLAKDFFGTFSYSHYTAQARDLRYPDEEEYFPWDFDFRNVLNIIGGYKIPLKGENIRPISERDPVTLFLARAIGWGAEELELSFRYRYVGGKPYTPLTYNHHIRNWSIPQGGKYNTERLEPYYRLDLMILWHSKIGKYNITSYFDIQNVFNHENIWDIVYNGNGTRSKELQFQVMPVGGFTIEF